MYMERKREMCHTWPLTHSYITCFKNTETTKHHKMHTKKTQKHIHVHIHVHAPWHTLHPHRRLACFSLPFLLTVLCVRILYSWRQDGEAAHAA